MPVKIDDRISVGAVIFQYVSDTKPPKNKYYIVVGINEQSEEVLVGTIYINSEVNPYHRNNPKTGALQVPITASENTFLHHDSFIDCSSIYPKRYEDVLKCVSDGTGRYGYHNNVSEELLSEVISKLRSAPTISAHVKRSFGII